MRVKTNLRGYLSFDTRDEVINHLGRLYLKRSVVSRDPGKRVLIENPNSSVNRYLKCHGNDAVLEFAFSRIVRAPVPAVGNVQCPATRSAEDSSEAASG